MERPLNEITIDCYAQESGALKEVGKFKIAELNLQYLCPPLREGSKEEKFFLNASAFGGQASKEILCVAKGDYVRVVGALSVRSWKDQAGNWKQSTGIRARGVEILSKASSGIEHALDLPDDEEIPF